MFCTQRNDDKPNAGWNYTQMQHLVAWIRKCWTRKVWSRANFIQHRATWFLFSFFFFYKYCTLSNASNISSNMENLRCWMKCWLHLRRALWINLKNLQKLRIHFFDVTNWLSETSLNQVSGYQSNVHSKQVHHFQSSISTNTGFSQAFKISLQRCVISRHTIYH